MIPTSLPLPAALLTPLGAEVQRGLTRSPRCLSPWLFYDEEGSRLFEAITELPEYYLTRTERALFARNARSIVNVAAAGSSLTIIELGAGTATKTGLLLSAAVRRQGGVAYHPIDVSASALDEAKRHLEQELPGVTVHPRVADYTEGLGQIEVDIEGETSRKLVLYIGSSIGNFEPEDAIQLLRDIRAQLAPGDRILVGADRAPHARKPVSGLLAAYNDAAGVTAAFNLNVLARINRELGANFDLDCFRHEARWNRERSRIEMHLVSLAAQHVSIPALELELDFAAAERIHTENSYKFTVAQVLSLLEAAGFAQLERWTDAEEWFGVYLATAV